MCILYVCSFYHLIMDGTEEKTLIMYGQNSSNKYFHFHFNHMLKLNL